MSRCREPKDCALLLREDYLECLHHSKEICPLTAFESLTVPPPPPPYHLHRAATTTTTSPSALPPVSLSQLRFIDSGSMWIFE
ncbi:hypothetical protein Drorol1_Dr00026694, partial [Drosera rotundifolia]